jgi:NADH-quinone oxidoreductase subunit M
LAHSGLFLLSFIIFLPAVGAALLLLVGSTISDAVARLIGFVTTALTFGATLCLLSLFKNTGQMEFVENKVWLKDFGISYLLGVDGLSLWLVVLTALLMVLVLIASHSIHKRVKAYIGFFLLLESGILGSLLSLDLVLFYVFWEVMLIPMYFLIGVWGGKGRLHAAIKFVLYTATGSLLMLVAIAYLGYLYNSQMGSWSFSYQELMKVKLSSTEEITLFLAFALAFAIKIPLFPLHTWLPDAHVEAPTGGSVVLAGVLLKLGLYGLIRFCIPLFPMATTLFQPAFAILGVTGIVFGALVAWVQTDMKKLVAYSSVSHLGFCVLGYAAMNVIGLQGAILQMLNHGVSTAALFFLVGVLYDRKHTRLIADYGGLATKLPQFSVLFLVFTLSSIGLPLTNGFVGEFLILLGGFKYNMVLGAVAVSGVVLGAIYMLSMYRRVVFGEFDEDKNGDLTDLTFSEKVVFAPLLALVFVLGLYPQPILNSVEPITKYSLSQLDARMAMKETKSETAE